MNDFNKIKEHYKYLTPIILDVSKKYKYRWTDPYSYMDWHSMFTPIEHQTWQQIRCFGKIPMYPQYPVGKYFLDFGNPSVKLGIECDGKEWHLDKEKDYKRDENILNEGWHIYRITGVECMNIEKKYYNIDDIYDENEKYNIIKNYYNTMDGLIKALAIFYFDYKNYSNFELEIKLALRCLQRCFSPAQFDVLNQYVEDIYFKLIEDYNKLLNKVEFRIKWNVN